MWFPESLNGIRVVGKILSNIVAGKNVAYESVSLMVAKDFNKCDISAVPKITGIEFEVMTSAICWDKSRMSSSFGISAVKSV